MEPGSQTEKQGLSGGNLIPSKPEEPFGSFSRLEAAKQRLVNPDEEVVNAGVLEANGFEEAIDDREPALETPWVIVPRSGSVSLGKSRVIQGLIQRKAKAIPQECKYIRYGVNGIAEMEATPAELVEALKQPGAGVYRYDPDPADSRMERAIALVLPYPEGEQVFVLLFESGDPAHEAISFLTRLVLDHARLEDLKRGSSLRSIPPVRPNNFISRIFAIFGNRRSLEAKAVQDLERIEKEPLQKRKNWMMNNVDEEILKGLLEYIRGVETSTEYEYKPEAAGEKQEGLLAAKEQKEKASAINESARNKSDRMDELVKKRIKRIKIAKAIDLVRTYSEDDSLWWDNIKNEDRIREIGKLILLNTGIVTYAEIVLYLESGPFFAHAFFGFFGLFGISMFTYAYIDYLKEKKRIKENVSERLNSIYFWAPEEKRAEIRKALGIKQEVKEDSGKPTEPFEEADREVVWKEPERLRERRLLERYYR